MKRRVHVLAAVVAAILLLAPVGSTRAENPAPHASPSSAPLAPSIVPYPKRVTLGAGAYEWPATIRIAAVTHDEKAAVQIFERFARAGGSYTFAVSSDPAHADVAFTTARPADPVLGAEGYALTVTPAGIVVLANEPAGFGYAIQTLAQITTAQQPGRLRSAAVSVRDWPSYRWRGIHLDVSRHFFSVVTLKRYLDLAARYKLNMFHWHLTDDEAWRIEIKSRSLLAEVGSCTARHTDCAYYTQAQIRDIVAYARERNIVVVPEIDVPGHSGAAIRAYPYLACEGSVGATVFCPTEDTNKFLDDVFAEVVDLFPGPFVHIGGDEVRLRDWRASPFVDSFMRRNRFTTYAQLQASITTRLARYLERYGRRPVAWDEALAAPIPKSVVIMAWRGQRAAALGARLGHDVVVSPDGPLYFDGYQGDRAQEPPAMRYRATLEQVYRFDPLPANLSAVERERISGVQANVWTEQIETPDHLFYMLLPRELALAEIAWAPRREDTWAGFRQRLPAQLGWLSAHGYNFRIPDVGFVFSGAPMRVSALGDSVQSGVATTDAESFRVELDVPVAGETRFTTDGFPPTKRSQQYRSPIPLRLRIGEAVQLQAAAFVGGKRGPVSRCTVRRTMALHGIGTARTYPSWSAMISDQRAGIYYPPTFP